MSCKRCEAGEIPVWAAGTYDDDGEKVMGHPRGCQPVIFQLCKSCPMPAAGASYTAHPVPVQVPLANLTTCGGCSKCRPEVQPS